MMKFGLWMKSKQPCRLSLEHMELRAALDRTRDQLDSIRNQFEQAVDPDLIDCYIYELNAVQLRYKFLLRRVKRLEEHQMTSGGLEYYEHMV